MQVVIAGAGTYSEVYLNYILECCPDYEVVGFVDDDSQRHNTTVEGLPVLGSTHILAELAGQGVSGLFCPIGENLARLTILQHARSVGLKTPSFIHPSVHLARHVTLEGTCYLLPGTVVMPRAVFKDGVMVSTMASIAHHAVLKDGVFLSTRSTVGANTTIETCAFLGMSSTVMTGVKTVGCHALIGAGTVVIRDVEEYAVMAGVPARLIRKLPRQ